MKIVNAVWEKRNLGCDAYEISLDKKDLERSPESLLEELRAQNFSHAYVVLKMPVGNLKILHALEDEGFRFMETQLYLRDHFAPLETPEQIQKWMQGMERVTVEKTREAWGRVIERITPGMFKTDRISLDPLWGEDVACRRYKNWCWDLFGNPNSWMWLLKVDGKEISFGVNVRDEKTGMEDGILGGVFSEYQGNGYGVFQILNTGCSKLKILISSNNSNILRIYQNYGMIIYKERYVLRKIYSQQNKDK